MAITVTGTRGHARSVDAGRLFAVPLLALFGLLNVLGLWRHVTEPEHSGLLQAAAVARSLLLVAFYALVVGFYFVRSAATATTASRGARAAALLATVLPLLIAVVVDPVEHAAVLWLANALMLAGLAWSLWALWHLGRNISFVAQARGLVCRGPYGMVRHPLYLGELVTITGLVLGGFAVAGLLVLAAVVALQLYRAAREEDVLAAAFPEYATYRHRTPARVVPGLY